MTRSDILSAAAACVTQDRNNTYGPPEDSFSVIAAYWSTYLGVPLDGPQVGTLLALMKIARLQHNPSHADSYVDGAGYLACAGELATKTVVVPPPVVPETFDAWMSARTVTLDDVEARNSCWSPTDRLRRLADIAEQNLPFEVYDREQRCWDAPTQHPAFYADRARLFPDIRVKEPITP
jgi:hypothetical protein